MRISRLLVLAMFFLVACSSPKTVSEPVASGAGRTELKNRPHNIILLIGDGMGLGQISAGLYANGNQLNLERCTVTGLHKPYASNDLITDSAAGATAFACGVKTYNGAIGVDAAGKPAKTILEEAHQRGLATGLIATSSITHATPASFIAHVANRGEEEAIATFFVDSGVDLFIGGGKKFFDRRETDERDLLQQLRKKNYVISHYAEKDLAQISPDPQHPFGYLSADNSPLTAESGRDYLEPATRMAPPFLAKRSNKGFFLMIEGSQIDWGGHANDTQYIVNEMLDFDKAVGLALDFAKTDGRTLVIITADHETGGFSINPGSVMGSIKGAFTTDQHTGTLIPVFAYGPGAELFGGVYENTAIYHKMRRALGFDK
jgi:alkaline phosphatase